MADTHVPPALFVTWQDQESRRIFPVGRLLLRVDEFFEFAYVRGAEEVKAKGFQPYLAFPELSGVYTSKDLFPFFRNRVMQPGRADYPEHVKELALEPGASPIHMLARTAGARATDGIEMFPELLPTSTSGTWETFFFARSVRHVRYAEERIKALLPGDRLFCQRDVQNFMNPLAVSMRTEDNVLVGFCPDYLAEDLTCLLEDDRNLAVVVTRTNLPPAPSAHRLLCHLTVKVTGTVPYRGERFDPISGGATRIDGAPFRAAVA